MAKSKKKKHNSFFGARLTSTISTSLVLFLLGIIALLGVMATQLTVYVRGNMGFSVVLDENVTDAQIKTLQKRLTAAPHARKVQYISKSDALKHKLNYGQDNTFYLQAIDKIRSCTPEDIMRLAQKYLNVDDMYIVTAGKN